MQRMTPDCCQSEKILRQLVGSKIDQFIEGIFKYTPPKINMEPGNDGFQ